MSADDAREHHEAWYIRPEEMVVAVCGPSAPEEYLSLLANAFGALPVAQRPLASLPPKTFQGGAVHICEQRSRVPRPATVVFLPIPTIDEDLDAGLAAVVLGEFSLLLLRESFPYASFSVSAGMLGAFTAKGGDVLVITALGWPESAASLSGETARLVSGAAFDAAFREARTRTFAHFATLTTEIEKRAVFLSRLHAFLGMSITISSLAQRLLHTSKEQTRKVAKKTVEATVGLMQLDSERDE
ncbi:MULTISPECIES: insulinase family protein [unclassified Leucobacter]|uniref:insulinase family protein n=1 Tax=unclassified Leucobacter TaxID=2621730 RepID=UPI0020412CB5|nr:MULTISPECIES: insulinase family protein [unclassified Leucobacter]